MAKKINNDELLARLMEKTGLPQEVVNLYFNKLLEALKRNIQKDGVVEIDGFGTFRLVDMKERESVKINTGERIVIPSYRKLTFVQAANGQDNARDMTEKAIEDLPGEVAAVIEESLAGHPEVTPLMDNSAESTEDSDTTITGQADELSEETNVIEPVAETPVDEFSGIDSLISTPESLDDLTDRVRETEEDISQIESEIAATEREIQALQHKLEELKASGEKKTAAVASLQELLNNMEQNRPAFVEQQEKTTQTEQTAPVEEYESNDQSVTPRVAAAVDTTSQKPVKKNRTLLYSLCAILLLALLALLFFLANRSNQQAKETERMEQVAKQQRADSLRRDSIAKAKARKPAKPLIEKVLFDGSTPLEILVTKHYGEHDIVFRVIQYNKEHGVFDDWTKIPVGTELLFPDFEQLDKKNRKQ
mgnify:CR=1 FL=1